MAKEYKLDLFKQTLPAIFNCKLDFYEKLTDEEKKEISPRVLMRWLSGFEPTHVAGLDFINTNLNRNIDILGNHPELQWKLLCAVGSELKVGSKNPRVVWYKLPKSKNKSKTPFLDKLILSKYPLLSSFEISLQRDRILKNGYEFLITEFGLSDQETRVLKDEIKKI